MAVAAGCGGDRRPTRPQAELHKRRLRPPPPAENARGVIGGPTDDTAFEFEPKPATEADAPPELDGVPDIPPEISARLGPYLDARRTRIASVDTARGMIVVLTRLGDTTQAYELATPGGELVQLTRGADPVAQAAYLPGAKRTLLFRRDRDGNEHFQLYSLAAGSDVEHLLTDGVHRHGQFTFARDGTLAFTSNARATTDMDVYVGKLRRRALAADRVVDEGGQWIAGAWSRDSSRFMVRRYRAADSSDVFVVDARTGAIAALGIESDESVTRDARFSADAGAVYAVSDEGGDVAELRVFDVADGSSRSLTAHLPWDVELFAMSPDGSELAFAVNEDGISALYVAPVAGEPVRVPLPAGVISTLQYAGSTGAVAFTLSTATEPADAYIYDPRAGALTRWTESEDPTLERKPFVAPTLERVESFDGERVPLYYYRPPGDGPFPVLLWVHGGPEAQHRPAFDPLLQYFVVERGIAVLAPNIRGSTGYGRRYQRLDNGVLRGDAVRDIGALLDWIAAHPELEADRVGIYGASYGGFMVLASMVAYGDRIAAGCDLVGISDFPTFLENTSAYRRDARRAEYGDERDPALRAFFDTISPLVHAAAIRRPLLVGHGANDPRVPLAQAQAIVQAVRANDVEVWYVLARDEGHGFRKRRSRDVFYSVMAEFFERHLKAPEPELEVEDEADAGSAE